MKKHAMPTMKPAVPTMKPAVPTMKPAMPPLVEVDELAASVPPVPEKPTFSLPAEALPSDLPPAGRLVIDYTTIPESADGEMRAFLVENLSFEGADPAEPEGLATADEAFDQFLPDKK